MVANPGDTIDTQRVDGVQSGIQPTDREKQNRLALYIPYTSWAERPPKPKTVGSKSSSVPEPVGGNRANEPPAPAEDQQARRPSTDSGQHDHHILHSSMTLDQYYCTSLEDTTDRDFDQVVSRYLENQDGPNSNVENSMGEAVRAEHPPVQPQNTADTEKGTNQLTIQMLMVDQLWLWIIDEKTIITSTTRRTDTDDPVLQKILEGLVNHRSKGWSRPTSVDIMLRLLVDTTMGFLSDKKASASGEASLFEEFQGFIKIGQKPNDMAQKNSPEHSPQERGTQTKSPQMENPYYDIKREIDLLRKIKDILDELHILKSLVDDQEAVFLQAFPAERPDPWTELYAYSQVADLKRELQEMTREAKEVQEAIYTLLDLKQKQANISEAKAMAEQTREAGMQTQHSARQNDTIMVFTVVTIIFVGPSRFHCFAFNASWLLELVAASPTPSSATLSPHSTDSNGPKENMSDGNGVHPGIMWRYRNIRSAHGPDIEQQ
ncbi:uncharacterized protein BO80DRAFT_482379 [Aspergillus ibericus CBS 121593]|uniref:Uncharacterized protein n=1 Tax=Aspergillus ibericus CBS 121593 TaxID=1448316 RepID=A0A395GPN7_9EURO|nr:hypothetical protein BO80DRAFT_482379 [Aspergillus ibericus CBS 121593]RAK97324.1 hypothetical protein BO80DRAFT_482379 [Aspergillus ibericus CBS 121593]